MDLSSFDFGTTRLSLRAVLISSLLVLAHVLLTTVASSPPVTVSGNIYGLQAVVSTSALIFLTLLWLTFTLVEAVDVHASHFVIGDEGRALFGRTWVEFLLNAILLRSWIAFINDALVIMEAYPRTWACEFAPITIAYTIAVSTLTLLQLQLIVSIALHVFKDGWRSVCTLEFWDCMTGHWTVERIALTDEEEKVEVSG